MVEQGARAEREYRALAYYGRQGPAPAPTHLRLPGGEQIGRFDPGATVAPSSTSCLRASVPSCLPSRTFATIDVNLACPVKKIDRKARGGHWLAESDGAVAILEAVREAVPPSIPCTVKLRRAYDDTPEMAASFERVLEAAFRIGYAWATVHGRTVEQKYIGPSRWDLLRGIVRRHPGKLIFGSGDVWAAADIFRMIAYTGVAGAAVARGCIGNPWLFRQARAMMAGEAPQPPTLAEQRAVLEEHFRLALAVNGRGRSAVSQLRRAEAHTGKTMRKFGIRFAEHHPRREEVRRRFIAVSSLEQWRGVLDEFYGEPDSAERAAAAPGLAGSRY
jgi:tRNA-dihydrouridine synthase